MRLWDFCEPLVRYIREFFQDQWFDRTRGVRTSGNMTLHRAGIKALADSEFYQPARPAHIRQSLREIPVNDVSSYTFIDLGSGKGRTLFIAAEFSFERIIGVEFSQRLNAQAVSNIRRFRRRARGRIASLHKNARDFVFPDANIVLYMFNPFGAATMQHVLNNLAASLRSAPRHVVIILLWPRCQNLVAELPGSRLRRAVKEYQIFEIDPAAYEGSARAAAL